MSGQLGSSGQGSYFALILTLVSSVYLGSEQSKYLGSVPLMYLKVSKSSTYDLWVNLLTFIVLPST